MQLTNIDIFLIAIYFLTMVGCAFIIRRKQSTFYEYALTNRQLPSSMVFASLAATFIGPGYSLALSDKGFDFGLLFWAIFSFFALQTLFTARILAPKLQSLGLEKGCYSLGDVLSNYYGDMAKIFVGAISFLSAIGFAAIMAKVGGGILASLTGMPSYVCMAIITLVGLLYSVTGGLRAVVATEALQFAIILLAISLLMILAFLRTEDTWLIANWAIEKTTEGFKQHSILTLLGLAMSFFFGEMLIPPYANRILAAKDLASAQKGFTNAAIFATYWFLLIVLIGGLTFCLAPNKPNDTPALLALTYFLHIPGLSGLIVAAVAAIVMSSQESVLNAGATAFVREFNLPQTTNNARTLSVLIGLLSLLVAIYAPSVISLLLLSYAVWAPAVAIPLAWALLGGKALGHFIMMPMGLAFSLYACINIPSSADNGLALLYGIVGNFIGYLISIFVNFKR